MNGQTKATCDWACLEAIDECGVNWHLVMDWGPFWMGANAPNRIIRIHLPQYWLELTMDCKDAVEAEKCFFADFPVGVEHEILHIVLGGWLPIEVEHRMIERLTGRDIIKQRGLT